MKKLSLVVFFLISFSSFGQAPAFKWVKAVPFSIASQCSDAEDNIYIAGQIKDTTTLEDHVLYPSNGHIVIAKIDSSGNLLWVRQAGELDDNEVIGIQCDQNNDLVILNHFNYSNIYFGDTLVAPGHDVVMIKYSKDGDLLWYKVPGYCDRACFHVFSFTIDRENNIIIYGDIQFGDFGIFPDTTIATDGVIINFIAKYYPDGSFAWVRKFWNSSAQITSDHSNNILVFSSMVQKYSANDQLIWEKPSNIRMQYDNCPGVGADSADNSYISVYFNSSASIGNDTVTPDSSSNFLYVKLNPSGVPVLTREARSTQYFRQNSISVNKNKVGITGTFKDKLFFDNDSLVSVTQTKSNSFIALYDLAGNRRFIKKIDGKKGCSSFLISVSKSIYVSGYSYDTTYFDNIAFLYGQAPYNNGNFLARIQDEVFHPIFYPETVEIFPNPTRDYLTLKINPSCLNATLEIYSIQGKLTDSYFLDTYSKTLNLEHLSKGLYFIRIKTNEKTFINKFEKI